LVKAWGAQMSSFQAFWLGVMVALTPSMTVIAFFLWRAEPVDDGGLCEETRESPAPNLPGAKRLGSFRGNLTI
jgi:hypothetical protein